MMQCFCCFVLASREAEEGTKKEGTDLVTSELGIQFHGVRTGGDGQSTLKEQDESGIQVWAWRPCPGDHEDPGAGVAGASMRVSERTAQTSLGHGDTGPASVS